jgi:orotate phosphoribosyltransferase
VTTTRSGAAIAADGAVAARTEALFRRAGALREGHFLLKSGRHSDRYLEKFQVLQFPDITSELCGLVAAHGRTADGSLAVDVVAGPTTGGVILAFETARQLGVRSLFAEEVHDGHATHREFRRGFTMRHGERVLLVDDILTTGGSLAAMLPAIETFGADVVDAIVLVDRSGGTTEIVSPASGRRYPLAALWRLELATWEPGQGCPGCVDGVPLEAPGSGGAATSTA